jgi:hypothetical protein
VVRFSNNGVQMNMAVERGPFDGQPPKPTIGSIGSNGNATPNTNAETFAPTSSSPAPAVTPSSVPSAPSPGKGAPTTSTSTTTTTDAAVAPAATASATATKSPTGGNQAKKKWANKGKAAKGKTEAKV